MGAGPLIAATGILLLLRLGRHISYVRRSLARAALVRRRPVDDGRAAHRDGSRRRRWSDAGIASAINNAVARVAGLVGVSGVGVAIAGELPAGTFAAVMVRLSPPSTTPSSSAESWSPLAHIGACSASWTRSASIDAKTRAGGQLVGQCWFLPPRIQSAGSDRPCRPQRSGLPSSRAFFEQTLAPVGYRVVVAFDEWKAAGFDTDEKPVPGSPSASPQGTGTHVAFVCPDRATVGAFHEAASRPAGSTTAPPGCGSSTTDLLRRVRPRPRRQQHRGRVPPARVGHFPADGLGPAHR